jgi:hypothetical protein
MPSSTGLSNISGISVVVGIPAVVALPDYVNITIVNVVFTVSGVPAAGDP